MTPKKAIIIVLTLFLVVAIIFVFLYLKNKPAANELNNVSAESAGQIDVKSAIDKINNNQKLTPQEQQAIKMTVQDKVNEKVQALQNTPAGSPNANAKENIDFLLNPQKTVEQELGIKRPGVSPSAASSSRMKVNDLLNPSQKR